MDHGPNFAVLHLARGSHNTPFHAPEAEFCGQLAGPPALTWPRSFVLEEGVLLEEATEAGLLGASFFSPRALSIPFSGGECAGLTRGVAGS